MKLFFAKVIVIISALSSVAQDQAQTPFEITTDPYGIHLKGKFYILEGTGDFPTVILLQGFPGNEQDVLGIGK